MNNERPNTNMKNDEENFFVFLRQAEYLPHDAQKNRKILTIIRLMGRFQLYKNVSFISIQNFSTILKKFDVNVQQTNSFSSNLQLC